MHLVVLVEEFYPNTSGGALTRWRFCQRAVEKGHEVTVFTPRFDGLPAAETVDGVEIRRPVKRRPGSAAPYSAIGIVGRLVFSILLLISLARWFRRNDADGIHTVDYAVHWVGKVFSLVYRLPFVPLVDYTPSNVGEWRPRPSFVLERLNFRLFMGDIVLCRSHDVQSVIEEYTDAPVRVLDGTLSTPQIRDAAQTTDVEAVRGGYGIGPNEPLLAFVARLVPIKQPTAAIELLAQLPEEYRMVVVGDGPSRTDVEAAVDALGLESRVHHAGELPHRDTLRTIAAADALVLTSRTESYSTTALEGLALGCHVFATPVGVLRYFEHPRLHLGSTDEMARAIQSVDFEESLELQNDVLERFSMHRYTDEVVDAFDQLLARGAET